MQTIERLARTRRHEDARFMARLAWPGLFGLAIDTTWISIAWVGGVEPVADVLIIGMAVWWLLPPLALVCLLLAILRRGRLRWLAILANGLFLVTSVLVLGHGIT